MKGCEQEGLLGGFCVAKEDNGCAKLDELIEAIEAGRVKPWNVDINAIIHSGCANEAGFRKYLIGLKDNPDAFSK